VATVLVVWHQNHSFRFPGLGLKIDSCGLVIWPHKITVTFSWFVPQNQVGYDLLVVPQNRWEDEDGVDGARSIIAEVT
jgi:hypothetical protein